MSRLILIIALIGGLVAAASLVIGHFRSSAAPGGTTLPARRSSAVQKVSFTLLLVVLCGVATGWLGAD